MLTIGILGCGRIGQVHAASLTQISGARVGGVADPVAAAAQALSDKAGAPVMTGEALIDSPKIDAVVIGTPTDTHFDLIQKAAKAGKAIFCEKPIDMSVERIVACQSVVEQAGISFFTAFNRRFDPNFAAVQSRVAAGEIGNVELLTILSRDPSPPPLSYIRSSGGIFCDMMIHDLDLSRFLLGEDPVLVMATGSCLVDPEIGKAGDVDTAAVMLQTESGKICQISNSRRATYGYDQRIEVHGEKGMLRADNMLESSVEVATASGFRRAPAQHFFLERYADAYRLEMVHFIDAVKAGVQPSPNIEDGLKAQILADAATRALETGQPQHVSLDKGHLQ